MRLIKTSDSIKIGFGLLVVRIGLSFSMIYLHGYEKLINFSEIGNDFSDPFGIGNQLSLGLVVFAEFFCSILLIIGLSTRVSTVPLIITMIVATWVINGGKEFIYQEKSFIYLIAYATLLITGGGRFSIDYYLQNRQNKM